LCRSCFQALSGITPSVIADIGRSWRTPSPKLAAHLGDLVDPARCAMS
jgi:hypothetical protein